MQISPVFVNHACSNRSDHHRRTATAILLLSALTLFFATGCTLWLQPGSKGYDDSKHIWTSPRSQPQTVRLIDTRDDGVVFEMEIPAGEWLVTKLVRGRAEGDDPNYPDKLKYRIVHANKIWTNLRETMDVPPANSRRWELVTREAATLETHEEVPTLKISEADLESDADALPTQNEIDLGGWRR